jgi:hypothetical protein
MCEVRFNQLKKKQGNAVPFAGVGATGSWQLAAETANAPGYACKKCTRD